MQQVFAKKKLALQLVCETYKDDDYSYQILEIPVINQPTDEEGLGFENVRVAICVQGQSTA